jgi:hypothetical protein
MIKQTKNIIAYFLIATSLAIFLHSVIPHDHHYDINCELSHHQHNHDNSDHEPIHCHFFNEVIVDKAITTVNKKISEYSNIEFTALLFSNFRFTNTKHPKSYFPEQDKLILNLVFRENMPTRGSPLSVLTKS